MSGSSESFLFCEKPNNTGKTPVTASGFRFNHFILSYTWLRLKEVIINRISLLKVLLLFLHPTILIQLRVSRMATFKCFPLQRISDYFYFLQKLTYTHPTKICWHQPLIYKHVYTWHSTPERSSSVGAVGAKGVGGGPCARLIATESAPPFGTGRPFVLNGLPVRHSQCRRICCLISAVQQRWIEEAGCFTREPLAAVETARSAGND